MVDINLHQASEQELKFNKKRSFFQSGTFIAVVLLVVVLAIFWFTRYQQNSLIEHREELIQIKNQELSKYDGDTASELIDFKRRIDNIESNLKNKTNSTTILQVLENSVIENVYLNSLEYNSDDKRISIEAVAGSYDEAAKQILAFKKNKEHINDVRITDSGRNKTGMIIFSLDMGIK